MTTTWFITGAARGLGMAITRNALAHGNNVVATARHLDEFAELATQYGEHLYPLTLDVTDVDAVNAAVATATSHFGSIDVLVNNAGYANMDSVEEMPLASFKAQMDTDYYGTLYTIRAALPFMRRARSGRIINISSIGGRIGGPGLGAYQSAKFAVNGLSEVVASEVKPFGIHVTAVEPGGMRTEWGGTSMAATTSNIYAETVGQAVRFIHDGWHGEQSPRYASDPSKVAEAINTLSEMATPPLHLLIGKDAATSAQQYAENLAKDDARNLPLTESTSAF